MKERLSMQLFKATQMSLQEVKAKSHLEGLLLNLNKETKTRLL